MSWFSTQSTTHSVWCSHPFKLSCNTHQRIAIQLHEQKQVMEANIRSELEAEYASKCERWKEEQLEEQKKGVSLNKDESLSKTPTRVRTDPRASLVDTLKELHIGHTKQGHDLESDTISTAPVSCVTKRNSFKDLEEDTLPSPGGGSKQKIYEFEEDTLATQNSGQGETLIFEEKAELSPLYIGRIIGKGGEMIRDLQTQSGCGINVNGNVEANTPYIISYRGRSQEDIDFAKNLVAKLCTPTKQSSSPEYKHARLSLGKATVKQIMVPKSVIGRIMGKGGDMIRVLQEKSQARIQVDHNGDVGVDSDQRQVTITGTRDAISTAEQMVMYLSTNTGVDVRSAVRERTWSASADALISATDLSNGPYHASCGSFGTTQGGQSWDGSHYSPPIVETETIPCSRQDVGHIIGRKGATIKDLQQRSSCDIQIDQKNFRINITGARQGIESATSMLHDIMEKGPRNVHASGRHDGESCPVSPARSCLSFEQQYCHESPRGYDQYAMPSSPQQQQAYYMGST